MKTPLASWTLKEHLGLSWAEQVISHPLPNLKLQSDTPLCVSNDEGNTQVAQYIDNRIFYQTDLPAHTHRQFHLVEDHAPTISSHIKIDQEHLYLTNPYFGICLSWTNHPEQYPPSQKLRDCPPPILKVRDSNNAWFGYGNWHSELHCHGFQCEILYQGPVISAVRQVYKTKQGDITFTYHINSISPYVDIVITGTNDNLFATWHFDDITPHQAFWRPHSTDSWRGEKSAENRHRQVYDIRKTNPPDDLFLQPFYNWNRNGTMFWSCTSQNTNQALIIGAPHPSKTISQKTFQPHRIRNSKQLDIAIPHGQTSLAIGLIECNDLSQKSEQTQIETCYKHMHSQDLDTYIHMDIQWSGIETIQFPRLFIQPSEKDAIRNKAQTWSWFQNAFQSHVDDQLFFSNAQPDLKIKSEYAPMGQDMAGAYLASGDTQYAQKAYHHIEQKLDAWVHEMNQVGPTIDPLIGFAFAGPFRSVVISFDLIADALAPADRLSCLHKIAFLTEVFFSKDAWPELSTGLSRGNLNFHANVVCARGLAAALLSGHPKQAQWLNQSRQEAVEFLKQYHFESGCARESITYQFNVIAQFTLLSIALQKAGRDDLFQTEPKFKQSFDFLATVQTPPDPRVGFCMLPTVGHVTSYGWGQSLQACFAWAAKATTQSDPDFSKRMIAAWQRAGSPSISLHDFYHGQIWWPPLLLIDPALESTSHNYNSKIHTGLGAIFRNEDQGYLLIKMGPSRGHYDPDEGSLLWYAWGKPILADFGCQYNPNIECSWLHNRISFDKWNESGNPHFEIQSHHIGEHVDHIQGTLTVPQLHRWADRPIRDTNFDFRSLPEPKDISPVTWQRDVLYIRECETILIHDHIDGHQATDWNLQIFADNVSTAGNHAHCQGQFGIDLDVYINQPQDIPWTISSFEHLGFDEPRLPAWWWRGANWATPPNTTYGPVGEHALTLSIPAAIRTDYSALLIAHPQTQTPAQVKNLPDGFTWQIQDNHWTAQKIDAHWQITCASKWQENIP